jgi:8-oxo-dGTP pyrophosphatase MutT (NUDIX family)
MVERRLDARTSAAKEALEEAGILGKVSVRRIGRYSYEKLGGLWMVTVFLMRVDKVHDKWAEKDRKRRWVGISRAQRMVDEKKLKKLISKVPHLVSSDLAELKKVNEFK